MSRRAPAGGLGLPPTIRACLFDVDGVLTRTAGTQAAAWKSMFDDYLRRRAARTGGGFEPFDAVGDYLEYVDGRPRAAGVAAFLASRGIGSRGSARRLARRRDAARARQRKHELLLAAIEREGVEPYAGSVRYVQAVRAAGLRRAVVSGSTNCERVLRAAGIADLFEARVDGVVMARERLRGKPAPDAYLAAARALGVGPAEAAVFEDALVGVAAGRAGGFGYVVGVDRAGRREALLERGADVVVADLAELLTPRRHRKPGDRADQVGRAAGGGGRLGAPGEHRLEHRL